jgi:hypothetical protein
MRLNPLGTAATVWPTVPAPDDRLWLWSNQWNPNWQGKPRYSEKTFPSAILSTTNSTWPDLSSNPGRCGGKLATNRLSYGTAFPVRYYFKYTFQVFCVLSFKCLTIDKPTECFTIQGRYYRQEQFASRCPGGSFFIAVTLHKSSGSNDGGVLLQPWYHSSVRIGYIHELHIAQLFIFKFNCIMYK